MEEFSFDRLSFLIVDDAEIDLLIMSNLVKGLGDVTVYTADHGLGAVEKLISNGIQIDCILSDFEMPIMHGLHLLKAVRMGYRGIRCDLPFVMVTSYNEVSLVSVAIVLDVDAFILKPTNKEILRTRLTEVFLNRNSPERLAYLPADYANLDIDKEIRDLGMPKSRVNLKSPHSQSIFYQESSGLSDSSVLNREINPVLEEKANIPIQMECHFEEIPPNAVLLEDLKTVSGRLLYPKDMLLTAKILSQIRSKLEAGEQIRPVKVEVIASALSATMSDSPS